jgi:diguanylate cyclase (GGDEF)-like protein
MPHPPRSRWHLWQFAAATATDLMIIGLLATGHTITAGLLTLLAIIQLAWICLLATRREHTLYLRLAEASTDPVTGLPTRRPLYHHLTALPTDTLVTVAYLDVNGLKQVNDGWGHQVGDGLLAVVAQRLRAACVPGDVLAHLGGDEYALATGRDQHVLTRALARVNGHAAVGGYQLSVSVSIGTSRTRGGDPQLALGSAEAAMYTAKWRSSGIEHYDPTRDGPPRLLRQQIAIGRHRTRP